jgi:hypothetical protein
MRAIGALSPQRRGGIVFAAIARGPRYGQMAYLYLAEHLCCVLLTHATRCMHIVLHALHVRRRTRVRRRRRLGIGVP